MHQKEKNIDEFEMEGAEKELERRSKFLNSLIQNKKNNNNNNNNNNVVIVDDKQKQHGIISNNGSFNIRVRASDMPLPLQNRAFATTKSVLQSMPKSAKLDSKRIALSLKKEFDSTYGPAWHCIVGTSFGSYVTHSVGGFLYFSIDSKVYVLLFKTVVQPLD